MNTAAINKARSMLANKKGQLNNPLTAFIGLAITLVVVVFVIVFGIVMLDTLEDQVNDTTDAKSAAETGKQELISLLGWVGLVVLVFVMLILIGAILLIARSAS